MGTFLLILSLLFVVAGITMFTTMLVDPRFERKWSNRIVFVCFFFMGWFVAIAATVGIVGVFLSFQ